MTTVTSQPAPSSTSTSASREAGQPFSLRIRRYALVASPVLAAALAIGGTLADPGAGTTGEEMNRIYTANPDPLQWKSLLFHWSYAFWIAPALLMVSYVRGKGRWLANVAGVVGFTGLSTMPGLLFIDYVDSAIGQLHGVAAVAEFHAHIDETMWGLSAMMVPGLLSFVLALPLISLALLRAGLVRWWAPVSILVGFAAFTVTMAAWWGLIVTLVCHAVFAVALERATRDRVAAA
jgi:hypothetical protein